MSIQIQNSRIATDCYYRPNRVWVMKFFFFFNLEPYPLLLGLFVYCRRALRPGGRQSIPSTRLAIVFIFYRFFCFWHSSVWACSTIANYSWSCSPFFCRLAWDVFTLHRFQREAELPLSERNKLRKLKCKFKRVYGNTARRLPSAFTGVGFFFEE